jgi:hypothetical protein
MQWFEVVGTKFGGLVSLLTPDLIWEQSSEIDWLALETP